MTEQEFAQFYKFDKDDMAVVKPVMQIFKGTIVKTVRRTGEELKVAGMKRAEVSAGQEWMQLAFNAVKAYCKSHIGEEFQCEDVRKAFDVPRPKNQKAWGPVMARISRFGLAKNTGRTEQVDNPDAHEANAAVWLAA